MKRSQKGKAYLVPLNVEVPPDAQVDVVADGHLLNKLHECLTMLAKGGVVLVPLSDQEVQHLTVHAGMLLEEIPQVMFDVPGGEYSAVWILAGQHLGRESWDSFIKQSREEAALEARSEPSDYQRFVKDLTSDNDVTNGTVREEDEID